MSNWFPQLNQTQTKNKRIYKIRYIYKLQVTSFMNYHQCLLSRVHISFFYKYQNPFNFLPLFFLSIFKYQWVVQWMIPGSGWSADISATTSSAVSSHPF